jgi:hypothetical protein
LAWDCDFVIQVPTFERSCGYIGSSGNGSSSDGSGDQSKSSGSSGLGDLSAGAVWLIAAHVSLTSGDPCLLPCNADDGRYDG